MLSTKQKSRAETQKKKNSIEKKHQTRITGGNQKHKGKKKQIKCRAIRGEKDKISVVCPNNHSKYKWTGFTYQKAE